MMKLRKSYALVIAGLIIASACSTTRVLSEGQSRLVSNKIHVTNDNKFNTTELMPYLRQPAQGWSPGLCVYNWQNGKGKSWDKFVMKLGKEPVIFDSLMLKSSNLNLKDHLQYLGYYDSKVDAQVKKDKAKKVKVDYYVTLGKRYPIRSISYELPLQRDFIHDFYADTSMCSIKKGNFLSENDLENESSRSASTIRDKGYYDFNKNYYFFEADTVSVKDSASLRIIVRDYTRNEKEGDQSREFLKYTLGKISVTYPEQLKFRTKVLSDINNLKSGELYNEKSINNVYSRYGNINLFSSVNMQLKPREDEPVVDLDINLKKGKIQGFKLGFEASINTNALFGLVPQLSYYNKNIFHGGEVLNVSVSSNHQFKFNQKDVRSNEVSVAASLTLPRFIPVPTRMFTGPNLPQTKINASYNFQKRPEYTRNMASASFGYSGSIIKNLFYQLYPISLIFVQLPYIDPNFEKSLATNPFLNNAYRDHLDAGLNGTIYYSSTGDTNPKESFWYGRLQLDLSGNLLAAFKGLMAKDESGSGLILGVPYSQYVRMEASLGKTFVWGKKSGQALALRLLGGIGKAYGNSISLPFEKHFYAGGANSMRGWVARTLGPGEAPMRTDFVIPNQTGDMKLEANAEYRFLLFWKLAGAVFVDVGNVWNLADKNVDSDTEKTIFNWRTVAADWGYGLRADLGFLVLRVDMGLRVHDPARTMGDRWLNPAHWWNQGNYAIHFGVGYPF